MASGREQSIDSTQRRGLDRFRPSRWWATFRSVVRFRPIELNPVERRLRSAATVDDLRLIARRRLPGGVFDYIDGGAGDERTLARNTEGFGRIEFRPRVLRDVSAIDTTVQLFGTTFDMPLVIAPTGYNRLTHSGGELSVARAAAMANVPYSLSTMATHTIEQVASAIPHASKWFQVYTWKDRELVASLIKRAQQAGYEALWLTVDTAVLGNRERDRRRGFTMPPMIGPSTIVDGVFHPSWTWDFITNDPITFANVADWHHGEGHAAATASGAEPLAMAQHAMANFDQALSWKTVEWIRELWDGPLILKGIQSVEDARLAANAGVAGIAVSNHGGRQLDDAPVPIELLPSIAEAVGDQLTIICDGGIRRGADIVKAIALGADAVSIGRPYLWGAAAGGQRGVEWVLDEFRSSLRDTMALCGVTSIDEIGADLVRDRARDGGEDR